MDQFQDILRTYWGYPDFRGIQREIIDSIASGKDTLGLMPTGGGKSITFQVPALAQEGVCIVITPLIALMKDQVQNLRKRGIQAAALYSGQTRSEIIQILENSIFGGVKILYVSPERLTSEIFQTKLRHINVSFICVDEAHCISQWGYDFRPSYLRIADIRQMRPDAPVLALTATATPQVVDDIQNRLEFKEKNVFKMSFERKNLAYIVRHQSDKEQEMIHILENVNGSAIVYARSRKRTKEIAQLLNNNHIKATFYHAGLESSVKDQRQKAWQNDEVRVMVATNAFGMGIDKPDVRVVIHMDCPDSLEAYFQEAGRAGRDGNKSYAVLIYDQSDKRKLEKRITDTFPEKDYIKDVYEHLAYFFQIGVGSGLGKTFEFNIERFCYVYKFFPIHVDAALRILERCGYIHYEDNPEGRARLMFLISRNDLYLLDGLSPNEDAVITTLLRNYGGLFTDYAYIDESLIATQSGLTSQQIYMILKNLNARHIISFIPRRNVPYITYTQIRIDGERVNITKEAYEERKEQYIKRIHAVIEYAQNDTVCRSRQLLRYFGEDRSDDCHQCDVCIEHNKRIPSASDKATARQKIMTLLKDHAQHHITELTTLHLSNSICSEVLEELVAEEGIHIEGQLIWL